MHEQEEQNPYLVGEHLPHPSIKVREEVKECRDTLILDWEEYRRERYAANQAGISVKDGD